MPTVSVVIAAYNAEAFLGEAVSSVLAQTFTDFEVVVVDDGSTDDTADCVARVTDDRVRLIRSVNRGPSAARNIAIAASGAPWIAVLDADDFWGNRRLETLLDARDAGAWDMLIDDVVIVDGSDPATTFFEEIGLALEAPVPLDADGFIAGRIAGHVSERPGIIKPLVRRAFLAGVGLRYDEEIRYSEDWLLYCQCLIRGARALVVPSRTYFYRQRPGSLSSGGVAARFANQERIHARLSSEPLLLPELRSVLDRHLDRDRAQFAAWSLVAAVRAGRWWNAFSTVLRTPAVLRLVLSRVVERGQRSIRRHGGRVRKRLAAHGSFKPPRSGGAAG